MKWSEYQDRAMETYACPEEWDAWTYTPFLLREEIGEFCEIFSKHMRDGAPVEYKRVVKELGDVLWCLAAYDHARYDLWHLIEIPAFPDATFVFDAPEVSTVGAIQGVCRALDVLEQRPHYHERWRLFIKICSHLGLCPLTVAAYNLSKLADRKSRGVIHGEGDER